MAKANVERQREHRHRRHTAGMDGQRRLAWKYRPTYVLNRAEHVAGKIRGYPLFVDAKDATVTGVTINSTSSFSDDPLVYSWRSLFVDSERCNDIAK